jgi:hypothetical protein
MNEWVDLLSEIGDAAESGDLKSFPLLAIVLGGSGGAAAVRGSGATGPRVAELLKRTNSRDASKFPQPNRLSLAQLACVASIEHFMSFVAICLRP